MRKRRWKRCHKERRFEIKNGAAYLKSGERWDGLWITWKQSNGMRADQQSERYINLLLLFYSTIPSHYPQLSSASCVGFDLIKLAWSGWVRSIGWVGSAWLYLLILIIFREASWIGFILGEMILANSFKFQLRQARQPGRRILEIPWLGLWSKGIVSILVQGKEWKLRWCSCLFWIRSEDYLGLFVA